MSTWTLGRSWLVYAASYGVAGAGAAAAAMFTEGDPFVQAVAGGVAATLVLYLCSIVFKNSGFYDCYWSVVPVVYAPFWLHAYDAWAEPRALMASLVTVAWGTRLTVNWATHWEGLAHEDWRYVDLRAKTGGSYPVASFFALHLFPFALVTLGSWALHEAIATPGPLGPLDFAALSVGVVAVLLETVSDIQLHRFRRENTDRMAFLQSGLWAYSRHPNYCGEAMYWWSTALFALSVRLSPLMVLGAVGVSSMILFASIPMAEKRALAKRPHFADYQRRVSRLIPWFPGRA
jgi:steroid 5-alpha reductase family enzyme